MDLLRELLDLALRWTHVIAGIMWIGNSLLFNWLDRNLQPREQPHAGSRGMTWLLLASKEPRLSAAVPFYGPFPDGGSLAGSRAAVLGVYAELDARVNASRAAARAALRSAGLKHTIVTFPGVDQTEVYQFLEAHAPRG